VSYEKKLNELFISLNKIGYKIFSERGKIVAFLEKGKKNK
jgi:hypothetical protein